MPLRAGPSSRATCGLCGAPNATLPVLTLLTFVPILNRKKVMLFSDALQKTQKAQAAYQDTATWWTCVPPHYCTFWEWGGSLLGNDVNAKVQNITKMQLQSSEASRWKEFCTRAPKSATWTFYRFLDFSKDLHLFSQLTRTFSPCFPLPLTAARRRRRSS